MANSKHVAQLIGPTLVAITLSEALNLGIWVTDAAPVTYLNGCILFVAGLSIVRAHNLWTLTWPVLVTLVGWSAVIDGLVRMFVPRAHLGGQNTATYIVIALLFVIGAFLSMKGYSRTE